MKGGGRTWRGHFGRGPRTAGKPSQPLPLLAERPRGASPGVPAAPSPPSALRASGPAPGRLGLRGWGEGGGEEAAAPPPLSPGGSRPGGAGRWRGGARGLPRGRGPGVGGSGPRWKGPALVWVSAVPRRAGRNVGNLLSMAGDQMLCPNLSLPGTRPPRPLPSSAAPPAPSPAAPPAPPGRALYRRLPRGPGRRNAARCRAPVQAALAARCRAVRAGGAEPSPARG